MRQIQKHRLVSQVRQSCWDRARTFRWLRDGNDAAFNADSETQDLTDLRLSGPVMERVWDVAWMAIRGEIGRRGRHAG